VPDLIRSSSAWLESVRKASASTALTYGRGSGRTVTIPDATAGESREQVTDNQGVGVRVLVRDYVFGSAALNAARLFPPAAGDQIFELDGSVWELADLGGSGREGVWRWHDPPNCTAVRVHTKAVSYGVEAALGDFSPVDFSAADFYVSPDG
jgi:hypothetical protein